VTPPSEFVQTMATRDEGDVVSGILHD
jgi:hypothetical protein